MNNCRLEGGTMMNQSRENLLKCDKNTTKLIGDIILRLKREVPTCKFDALELSMDLTVCNNTQSVNLSRLLTSDVNTLCHDIGGISKYLDRETGLLFDCFLPRCHT